MKWTKYRRNKHRKKKRKKCTPKDSNEAQGMKERKTDTTGKKERKGHKQQNVIES